MRRRGGAAFAALIALAALALSTAGPAAAAPLFKHAAGFSFRYPAGWTVTEKEGVVVLTPPGPAPTGTEIYMLGTESVEGQEIARPDDPRLVKSVEQQLRRLSPALRRVGEVQRLPVKGHGVLASTAAVLDFSATGRAGQSVWARAYVLVVHDTFVMILGFGLREQVSARDAALREVTTTIVGDRKAAKAPPPPVAEPAPGPAPKPTAPIAAGPSVELGGEDWGLRARSPAGWKARQQGEVALLGHDAIAGLIIMRPHQEKNAAAVRAQMQKGLAEEGIQISPATAIKAAGKGLVAEYTGTAQGQAIRARIIGLSSPHGGGVWVFALTTPQQFGRGLTDAADALARSVSWIKSAAASAGPLVQHFAGKWGTIGKNSTRRMTLAPDGRFYSSSESYYQGRFKNSQGDWTGSWGAGGQSSAAGRWRAQGDKRSGVLVITLNNGSVERYRYQVHVEKGKTYWREYLLNGVLWAK
jgi:hypothetical protein